jgi:outer membrane PBP1 activator LpoA protein
MKSYSRAILRLLSIGLILVAFIVAGCHGGPNKKQLQALEETKQAAVAVEAKSSDCASEKAKLEQQLADAKAKVDQNNKEKALVQQRLSAQ